MIAPAADTLQYFDENNKFDLEPRDLDLRVKRSIFGTSIESEEKQEDLGVTVSSSLICYKTNES